MFGYPNKLQKAKIVSWNDFIRVLMAIRFKWRSNMARLQMRQMRRNQSGTIAEIRAGGELGRRIRDMGLVPGTSVTIKGRAPLKDPLALRLLGFTLTLRNSEADHIDVEVS
jgi:ferrous iron transport protein A